MDFDFSDDQRLLKDSVDRLIADRYDFEQRKKYANEPDGWSRDMWARYAELGLLGLPFPEAAGGFGGGPVETMTVMEAFGRGLVLEPYFATVTLGGGLLRHAGSERQQAALLPQVAAGELKLAFAHVERQSRYDLQDVGVTATRDGAGWLLNGEKSVVLHGDSADKLLVTARTGGSRRDPGGIGVFLVDATAGGVSRRGYPTQDGLRGAEVSFANARAEDVLGDPGGALPAVQRVADEAIAALCAEAVGGMAAMHALTVDYMKTRKQFGRAIGEFQVLQHRAVDNFVALEQARSMAMYATMMAASDDAAERRQAVSAAKVQIGRSGRHIGQEAVQLHGGIAMTMEYKVGHYFKRMTMIEMLFGDTDQHLAVVAGGGGLF
ncbi:acyl-CoA dehydrogenase family protein [Limobrevibacterium gyesilva]|uniref:Acyl-CoA dehydrogenase family protein n=1 Tax=Limobrevibacterium gyesilva TaxID=2991712 RepID=A0AA41YTY1_9PROT|nr:acyl-CoA dehydrogenase family protein [Limobrevibacterium gyesilva]MCW3475362.1 acyl-CoA dehydrogenase family protein [Limobrevibacterium gyesilva]